MRSKRSLDPSVRLDETTWHTDERDSARPRPKQPRSGPAQQRGKARGAHATARASPQTAADPRSSVGAHRTRRPAAHKDPATDLATDLATRPAGEREARLWLADAERDLRAALRHALAGDNMCVVLHRLEVAGRAGAGLLDAATILNEWAARRGSRLLERDGVEIAQLCFLAAEFVRTLELARAARRHRT